LTETGISVEDVGDVALFFVGADRGHDGLGSEAGPFGLEPGDALAMA